MKWIKKLFGLEKEKDPVIEAGEASIKQYSELYKKLDAYDKGELPEAELLSRSKDLRDITRATQ